MDSEHHNRAASHNFGAEKQRADKERNEKDSDEEGALALPS